MVQDYNCGSMTMRVRRTFHPVGQGAFYTEMFCDQKGGQVVVYDCGSETGSKAMYMQLDDQIDLFKNKFVRKPIDVLFISHFHADHISGIDRLLANVKVKTTIIPMLDWATFTLTRVRNLLQYYTNDPVFALSIDRIIRDLYLNGESSERFGKVLMVSPDAEDEAEDNRQAKGNIVKTGEEIYTGSKIHLNEFWEYVPFNSITFNDQRAQNLLNSLMNLCGVTDPRQLDLEDLIRNRLNDVANEYKIAMKNANDNLYTLVVCSRPVAGVQPQPCPRLSHCIYFGDFDCRLNPSLWDRFDKVFDYREIGTVQVPHHGAKGNWRPEMGLGDPRHYIVSAGSTNGHHHPSYWVLENIWENGHRPYVVSEKWQTRREYDFTV